MPFGSVGCDGPMLNYVLYAINGLVMLVLPLALATTIARRYRVGWGLFGIGAATFVASQLLHLPFVRLLEPVVLSSLDAEGLVGLVASAAFLGLAAGLFEEPARYLAYRFWATDARSWPKGLMLGAGHGGIEAILLGLLFYLNISILAGLRGGHFSVLVPETLLAPTREQAELIFTAPWPQALLGAVERGSALALHLALSTMVLQCFKREKLGWLLLAVGWHALANGVGLVSLSLWGPYVAEGLLLLMALLSVLFVFAVREEAPLEEDFALTPPQDELGPIEIELSDENLEGSRYD